MDLPQPVAAALVRAMAAFLRDAKRGELPAQLRPLQGKHHQLLTRRRDEVLGALEDESLRAQVVEWLTSKPAGIAKKDAASLETYARRDEGWMDALRPPSARRRPAPKTEASEDAALEREKQRSRKARKDARRVKEAAAASVAAAERRVAELETELQRTAGDLAASQRELALARKEVDRLRGELQRELRKSRRQADRTGAALEAARKELRDIKSQRSRASQAAPKPRRRPATQVASASPAPEPARRRRLRVPKGRLADAPETLEEWLSRPQVSLLIDGYNVTQAEGGFGDLSLESQRRRLLQEVGGVAAKHRVPTTIVFDGSEVPQGTKRRPRGPVRVEYSRPDEIADDHLVAKLEGLPKHPVVVVTNDRELQRRAARLGATIATSDQLLGVIRDNRTHVR